MSFHIKKLPLILAAIFLMKFSTLFSQSLSGIYFSEYEKVTNISSKTYSLESEKLNQTERTSNYYQIFIILDFINEKEVLISIPDQEATLGKYTLKDDKLKIISNILSASGFIKENNEIILREKELTTENEKSFLPISKTLMPNNIEKNFSDFSDTYWAISCDKNPDSINYYYHIIDTSYSIVTTIDGEYARSFIVETEFETYKNHLFLVFLDHLMMNTRVYHIQKFDTIEIQVDYLDFPIYTPPPQRHKIVLTRTEIEIEKYNYLKEVIIGKWISTEDIIPIGFRDENDSLTLQKLVFEFKENGCFKIEKSATLNTKEIELPLSHIITGKWRLGGNLKYIELLIPGKSNKLITLANIQDETARISMEIKAFSEPFFQESNFQINKIKSPANNTK